MDGLERQPNVVDSVVSQIMEYQSYESEVWEISLFLVWLGTYHVKNDL